MEWTSSCVFNHHQFMEVNEDKGEIEEKMKEKKRTSQTEFGQQMRSGNLSAYLSLNCLKKGIVFVPDAILFKFSPFLGNSIRV